MDTLESAVAAFEDLGFSTGEKEPVFNKYLGTGISKLRIQGKFDQVTGEYRLSFTGDYASVKARQILRGRLSARIEGDVHQAVNDVKRVLAIPAEIDIGHPVALLEFMSHVSAGGLNLRETYGRLLAAATKLGYVRPTLEVGNV